MSNQIKETSVFVPVSVADELPQTEDTVFIITSFDALERGYYEDGCWHGDLRGDEQEPEVVTEWLKEKSLYCFSKEELEMLLTKTFYAGGDHCVDKYHKQDHETNKFPGCSRFIKSILP